MYRVAMESDIAKSPPRNAYYLFKLHSVRRTKAQVKRPSKAIPSIKVTK